MGWITSGWRERIGMRLDGGHLALAALLLWTAFSFALEVYRSHWLWRADPWSEERPSTWRITSRPVQRLSGFAAQAARSIPAGSRVAVRSEPGPEQERFFRCLWLVFLLPDRDVQLATAPDQSPGFGYWIAYGTRLQDPRLETLFESPDGAVYRLRTAR